jgi:hypothetical protein
VILPKSQEKEHIHNLEDFSGQDKVRSLVRLLQKDDAVAALIDSCNEVGEAFLFGGLVRDALLGSSGVFGDVDIFVSGPLNREFVENIARSSRRTNFGGIRLVVGKFDVDIWELPKSHAFRIEQGRSISIPSLLNTVCFSTDAVAASLLNSKVIASARFKSTLRSRVVSFVKRPNAAEILQVVRIARLIVRNGVIPDEEVARYFVDGEKLFGREALVSAEVKWKGRRVLDLPIMDRVSEICSTPPNSVDFSADILSPEKFI